MNIRNDIRKRNGREKKGFCVGYNCPTSPIFPCSLRQNSSHRCDSTSETLGGEQSTFYSSDGL